MMKSHLDCGDKHLSADLPLLSTLPRHKTIESGELIIDLSLDFEADVLRGGCEP